ncbi:hypothetical protein ACSGFO_30175 [Mesorhizobium sp. WSM4083]
MEAGETVSKLADEVGISRQPLHEWRDHLRLRGNLKSRRRGRPARSITGVDARSGARRHRWYDGTEGKELESFRVGLGPSGFQQ